MNHLTECTPCFDVYGRLMMAKRVTDIYGGKHWINAACLEKSTTQITLLTKYRGKFLRVYDMKNPPEHGGSIHRENLVLETTATA